jgi:hypothetical protein
MKLMRFLAGALVGATLTGIWGFQANRVVPPPYDSTMHPSPVVVEGLRASLTHTEDELRFYRNMALDYAQAPSPPIPLAHGTVDITQEVAIPPQNLPPLGPLPAPSIPLPE